MNLDNIILLGDPRLYQACEPVEKRDLPEVSEWTRKMDGVILAFRRKYGVGRAIAAPQLGYMKRLVCMHIDEPVVMINPELSDLSDDMFELWDDCMSFPNLLVRVRRHRKCTLTFRDAEWQEQRWELEDDLSELLQHEVDHLNGVLAVQRAIGEHPFRWRKEIA